MTKGIVLWAYKRQYYWQAYNMAFSIKHFNPDIKIFLWTDDGLEKEIRPNQLWVFDQIGRIPSDVLFDNNKPDPCNVKLNLYDACPFDYNLYLDVDGICMQNIEPMLDELIATGDDFVTTVLDTHQKHMGRVIPNMNWAFTDDIWSHYTLSDEAVLPCINSSFMFIKKGEKAKAIFDKAKENYANKIPLNKLRHQWGGGQPDELYFNIALCQLGLVPKSPKQYLLYGNRLTGKSEVQNESDYYVLAMWGNARMILSIYKTYYDNKLIRYHKTRGEAHLYKWSNIQNHKHANIMPVKFQPEPKPERQGTKMKIEVPQELML